MVVLHHLHEQTSWFIEWTNSLGVLLQTSFLLVNCYNLLANLVSTIQK